MKARDIMTRPVAHAVPGSPLPAVLEIFEKEAVSGVPVVDEDGAVVGFISALDLLKAAAHAPDFAGARASDIMAAAQTVDGGTPLPDVVGLMVEGHHLSLAVTEGGRLAGIISRGDMLRDFLRGAEDSRDFAFIPDTVKALLKAKQQKEALKVLTERMGGYFEATRCSVVRVEKERGVATVLWTFEEPEISGLEIELSRYPEIMEACSTGRPVILPDAVGSPLMSPVLEHIRHLGAMSILVFPIMSDHEVMGALYLRSQMRRQFSQRGIRVAEALAELTAYALRAIERESKLRRLYRDAEKKVALDDLTGLYNRRFFNIRLAEEFNMGVRHGLPISCVMFDIDGFKEINDTMGHEEGDRVLKQFADCLRKSVRISDVVARYAGDEFFLLLPVTDVRGALREAERIKGRLDRSHFGPPSLKVTVSVGVAGFPCPGVRKPEDMIRNADRAMYEAKRLGRDRIWLYETHGPSEEES
ncbi:MAG: hypothetical protein Kow0025_18710 [Thermodesulfovibrionales bacterium]